MNFILNILQKFSMFEKEPQKIGLSQLKEPSSVKKTAPSIKSKEIRIDKMPKKIGYRSSLIL